jgi:hypothetical protein
MAKITDFETPTGQKGNLFSPMTWIPLITGSLVLLATFSAAQKLGGAIGNKIPLIDSTPNSPWQSQPVPSNSDRTMYFG